ncbi:hypothetical protein BDZ91DRAFT_766808 [Kalaharituber pfeilii]|nr:hypothetical protein BDZ91DRAFT_766808 [Kalaharituber pfeilii]
MRKNGLSGRAGGVEIEASCELIFSVTAEVHRRPASSRLFPGLVWLASTPFGREMAFLEWYGVFLELQKRASTANPTAPAKNEKRFSGSSHAAIQVAPLPVRLTQPFAPVRRCESSQRGQQADGLALHATERENAAVTSMRACTGDCDGVGLGVALFFFGCPRHSMRNVFRNRAYYWLAGGSSTVAAASSVWLHTSEAVSALFWVRGGPASHERSGEDEFGLGILGSANTICLLGQPSIPIWDGLDIGTWGSDHGEDLMHGGSPQRGLFFPLVPAGRPGTALCDVVPGSSVLAGEEKVPVETRIAGWDDAREREFPFLGNAARGCATTLAWGIAPLFNLFVFPAAAPNCYNRAGAGLKEVAGHNLFPYVGGRRGGAVPVAFRVTVFSGTILVVCYLYALLHVGLDMEIIIGME